MYAALKVAMAADNTSKVTNLNQSGLSNSALDDLEVEDLEEASDNLSQPKGTSSSGAMIFILLLFILNAKQKHFADVLANSCRSHFDCYTLFLFRR